MKPLEHDRRYGELDQVMRAHLGQSADDTPERRSRALGVLGMEVGPPEPLSHSASFQSLAATLSGV
ncbi:hypothetical protein [Streptomyces pulveraceus]|uniref:Uncharacterized protein n=1 Tax=Streptomyces pulveraceus TaxID=68258 RepID=A0ABW1GTV5_9ACTN